MPIRTGKVSTGKLETVALVRSDSLLNFSDSIIQNAIENESIDIPNITELRSYILIKHISLQSVQQLNFRLFFWINSDYNTNFDATFFKGYVDFDLTTYGAQIGATGTYYLDVSGLNMIHYDSESVANDMYKLHVGLQNLSATAKNAGATGKVRIDVAYELKKSGDV